MKRPYPDERKPENWNLSRFFYQDFNRPIFKGKTLVYIEEELIDWVQSKGDLVYPLPRAKTIEAKAYADDLDGLVLLGGSDVSPRSYGQEPLKPEWEGDAPRDEYEIELIRAFESAGKPILGVCRGCQLLNVANGGTLHQDINTEVPGSLVHRDWDHYDSLEHPTLLTEGGYLSGLYEKRIEVQTNSVHHQAINELADCFKIEARSKEDGIIEAISHKDPNKYQLGIQWHPEWHKKENLLNSTVILDDFLTVARSKK